MKKKRMSARAARLQTLAEFRNQLRLFLHFSEMAALKLGLQPRQHQLLPQIAGAPDRVAATIGYAAERLSLRHNTVVELTNRCEEAGLVVRKRYGSDQRCVLLEVSLRGQKMLEALSIDHARELSELAPRPSRTLTTPRAVHRKPGRRANREERGI